MGLGKTAQMLALCLARPVDWQNVCQTEVKTLAPPDKTQKEKTKGPVLVIAPVSVNVEWDAEIEKHCQNVSF